MDSDFIFFTDIVLGIVSALATWIFLAKWFKPVLLSWPKNRATASKVVLGLLPVVAAIGLAVYLWTLSGKWFYYNDDGTVVEFSDPANFGERFFYVLSYILWGFTWIYAGLALLSILGISADQDALHADNKAALFPVAGVFLAMAAIYMGTQFGGGGEDGGGWWIVLYSGAFSVGLFFVFSIILNASTGIIGRVTSGRNTGAGIRLGAFFLGAGLLLARSSSGDWHSALDTIIELLDGWTVAFLTAWAIGIEHLITALEKSGKLNKQSGLILSIIFAGLYLTMSAIGAWIAPSLVKALHLGFYAA